MPSLAAPLAFPSLCVGLFHLRPWHDVLRRQLHVAGLCSQIIEVEARSNQLWSALVKWADGKQLTIAPQKSSVKLFTSDTHQSRIHPQVRIGDVVAPLNRTPKILGVTMNTHFTFCPRARDCVERPILNYWASIWFTQVSSTHLDKLEVIQNKALRIATGCYQKAAVSHLIAETGVLPLRAHLELSSQQFYASVLQPMHSSHLIVTSCPYSPPPQCHLPGLIPPYLESPVNKSPNAHPLIFGGVLEEGAYPLARRLLRGWIVRSQAPNKMLMATPPSIDPA